MIPKRFPESQLRLRVFRLVPSHGLGYGLVHGWWGSMIQRVWRNRHGPNG